MNDAHAAAQVCARSLGQITHVDLLHLLVTAFLWLAFLAAVGSRATSGQDSQKRSVLFCLLETISWGLHLNKAMSRS